MYATIRKISNHNAHCKTLKIKLSPSLVPVPKVGDLLSEIKSLVFAIANLYFVVFMYLRYVFIIPSQPIVGKF